MNRKKKSKKNRKKEIRKRNHQANFKIYLKLIVLRYLMRKSLTPIPFITINC